MTEKQPRLRRLNDVRIRADGDYVLYWIQAYRRLKRNHALDCAVRCSRELAKPLVVYEGLKLGYPWASERLHRFILEGMQVNAAEARRLGLNYWPFVETPSLSGRGLLRRLAERAAAVVTDDFPCFIFPGQSQALANASDTPVLVVDSNGIVPLALLGEVTPAAVHLRRRIHKAFAGAWRHRSSRRTRVPKVALGRIEAPFPLWDPSTLDRTLAQLSLDRSVPAVTRKPGGHVAARRQLRWFMENGLRGYASERSEPRAPQEGHASGLSPYLHFGHISIEEVAEAVLDVSGGWSPDELRPEALGRREGFFSRDPDVNAFLDEALTWRDLGYHWHRLRWRDTETLEKALPAWASATLGAHASDRRSHVYSRDELEDGATHDPLWNAAQRELVATGTIHNYLRMLWGKKVIEWSRTPAEAYATLVELNNKYALDGRDPNSYTGILWCFGLFDRPWAPERTVLGRVRYMSSDNTARKFKLGGYLAYVETLPTIREVRHGS